MPDLDLAPIPWPQADAAILAAIQSAFADHSWGVYHGPNVDALEAELAQAFRVSHAVTCASGTLAVEIALRAVGVSPGDDVILAAYDYEANFLNVHALQARPVLVDIDPQSGQMDIAQLDQAKSSVTKAIIASHLHGGLVPMRRLMEWAKSHSIAVIEDAAQAPGAMVDGRPAGSWGDLGILSFGGSKLLSAGRGGAILTNNDRLHQRAKIAMSRGMQQWAALSELQAIVLRPQLACLEETTQSRLEAVKRLVSQLPKALRPFADFGQTPAFYKVGFWYDGPDRDGSCKRLREQGIAIDPGFAALHVGRSPSRFRAIGELPHATKLHHSCVVLHHPILTMDTATLDRVAAAMHATSSETDPDCR